MSNETNRKIYCCYHNPCYDGFGSAYSAWRQFGKKAEYIPCSYAGKLPEIEDGSVVYFLDFSTKADVMRELGKRCKVIVLDHHKSAEDNLKEFEVLPAYMHVHAEQPEYKAGVQVRFDMNKSGAMLAWEFFNPTKPAPKLIDYVQDRDLWKHELENTKEFNAYLKTFEFDFQQWDNINAETSTSYGFKKFVEFGVVALKQEEQLVKLICSSSAIKFFPGPDTVVAFVNTSSHWSDVGNALLNKHVVDVDHTLSVTYLAKYNNWMFSLRSRGDFDVSNIAKHFGGGGHKNAAGFNLDFEKGLAVIKSLEEMGEVNNG